MQSIFWRAKRAGREDGIARATVPPTLRGRPCRGRDDRGTRHLFRGRAVEETTPYLPFNRLSLRRPALSAATVPPAVFGLRTWPRRV
eukprot:gene24605-biopygen11917